MAKKSGQKIDMSIYTKTGDNGTTGLFGGARVTKDSAVIDVLGNIDELNAFLGIVLNNCKKKNHILVVDILQTVQKDLFKLGTVVANFKNPIKNQINIIDSDIKFLEKNIDAVSLKLDELNNFILPGGSQTGAKIHFARSVCRRAERSLVSYKNSSSNNFVNELKYLNRLSDLLFVLARYINKLENKAEVIWKS